MLLPLRRRLVATLFALGTGLAQAQGAAPSALDGALFYQLLMAELELQRGESGKAYQLLLDGARRTGDERLYRRATGVALQAQAMNEALAAVRAWRRALPQSGEAQRSELQLLALLGQWSAAHEPLLAWLETAPLAQQVALMEGLPGLLRNRAPQAIAALRPALAQVAGSARRRALAQALLARLAQLSPAPRPAALPALRQALQLDPSAALPRWVALGSLRFEPEAEALVQAGLGADSGLHQAYAEQLARDNRPAEALVQRDALLALQAEQRADHQLARGQLLLDLHQASQALAALDDALAAGAAPQAVQLGRAQALQSLQRWPEADAALAQLPAEDLAVVYRRALGEARQGRLPAARALLQAWPAGDPAALARRRAAEMQLLRELQDWQGAAALIAQSLAAQGASPDPELLYEQALNDERLGRAAEAERRLREVIAADPEHAHAHNALGYLLAERNERLTEARALIERALLLGGREPAVVDSLGWVAFREGRLDEAETLLREALRGRPDAEIAAHLAELLSSRGQREDARRLLDEAQQREPQSTPLRRTRQRLGL